MQPPHITSGRGPGARNLLVRTTTHVLTLAIVWYSEELGDR